MNTRRSARLKDYLVIVAINGLVLLAIIGVLETLVLSLLWFPSLTAALPEGLKYHPVSLYTHVDRRVTRDFSVWDPELTYTLKPGISVRHRNREFDVEVRTNSLGLRDDEASLQGSDVIAIGDSFTMGFGVEQDEAFPALIERQTGLKVLNAGIESYGTAREVLAMKRLDTSRLKYLVVQYCPNDLAENLNFVKNHGHLQTLDKVTFEETYRQYKQKTRYLFGSYLWVMAANAMNRRPVADISRREREQINLIHSKTFLDALVRMPVDLTDVQVIAFPLVDLNASYLLGLDPYFDSRLFVENVRRQAKQSHYPAYIRAMIAFDSTQVLGHADRFVLDGHINAQGHARLAVRIIDLLDI